MRSTKAGGAVTKAGLACLLLACTMVASGKGKDKAVFLRNNEVWIVNEDGSGLKQLTKDGRGKHHPVWSPDGRKIAYHLDFDSSGKAEIIIIGAERGEALKALALPASSAAGTPAINSILGMEWLNSDRFAYEGHVNPSMSEYRVVDLTSGRIIRTVPGSCFHWSPDRKKLAVCGWLPHFSAPQTLHQFVQINGRTVYTLPKGSLVDYVASDFSWSADSTKVAFLERDDTVDKTKLVILSIDRRRISAILSPKTDVTRGVLWLNNEALVVQGDNSVWAYSYARQRLAKLSASLRQAFEQHVRAARVRENLVGSLKGNEASWWPNS
jgi:dipeptidyl aminopeptidase/acylaminoacyl peptidase